MAGSIRTVHCGLGPIGLGIARELAGREGLEIVGGVDLDPAIQGRDIGNLAGMKGPLGVTVCGDVQEVLSDSDADVAVLATTSGVLPFEEQVLPFIRAGLHVVSTCEELSFPFETNSEVALRIDEAARAAGVAVLGTGINPGFLMDLLPLVLTAVSSRVDRIEVERVQDASRRRVPFQKKVGAGLSLEEFSRRVDDRTLRHVGLTESMDMIASTLGWSLDRREDEVLPVVAQVRFESESMVVEPGHALGVEQTGTAFIGEREVIRLRFRAVVGQEDPCDRVLIEGDPTFAAEIPGGINGDRGTCAIVANAVYAVAKAAPGLRTMKDIAPVTCGI